MKGALLHKKLQSDQQQVQTEQEINSAAFVFVFRKNRL